jgi:hypothetical protein
LDGSTWKSPAHVSVFPARKDGTETVVEFGFGGVTGVQDARIVGTCPPPTDIGGTVMVTPPTPPETGVTVGGWTPVWYPAAARKLSAAVGS